MSRPDSRRISMEAKIASQVGQRADFETASQQQLSADQISAIQSLLDDMLGKHRTKPLRNRVLENEYVLNMKGSTPPDELIQLMQEFNKTAYFPTARICHNLMRLLAYYNLFPLTEKIYLYILHWKVADEFTFSNIIDAAGKNGELELAEAAFNKAVGLKKCNEYVYSCMINVAGKNGSWELAHGTFLQAHKAEKINPIVFTAIIAAAGETNKIDQAKVLFEQALDSKCYNVKTFTTMIDIAGKTADIDYATSLLELAKKTKDPEDNPCCNAATYTSMINTFSHMGHFDQAFKFFTGVKHIANEYTFSSIIMAAGEAMQATIIRDCYLQAHSKNCLNPIVVRSAIDAASKCSNLQLAEEIFAHANAEDHAHATESQKLLCDASVYASMIDAAGRSQAIERANALFIEASQLGRYNENTYISMMKAAATANEFARVNKIFAAAKAIYNSSDLYNTFLEACGTCQQIEALEACFETMRRSLLLNTQSYIIMVVALLRCSSNQSARIIAVFDEAFLKGQWNDHSFAQLEIIRQQISAENLQHPTIINHAIASKHVQKHGVLSEGAFGQVFRGHLQAGTEAQRPIAIKEIHIKGTHTHLGQIKQLPTKANSADWMMLFDKYVSKDKSIRSAYLCLYISSQRDWLLCSLTCERDPGIDSVHVICRTHTSLKDEFEHYLSRNGELSQHFLTADDCKSLLDTEYATVHQRIDLRRKMLKLCELALQERKQTEWKSLRDEVTILIHLSHPHIAQFYGITLSQEPYGMLMKLYPNGDLSQRIHHRTQASSAKAAPISEQQQLQFAIQMLLGLAYLHSKGLVHGDLKPKNMLLDENDTLVLTDFGLSSFDNQGGIRGTFVYMAPELLRHDDTIKRNTAASDIYAMAVAIWELLSFKHPWHGKSRGDIAHVVQQGESLILRDSWPAHYARLLPQMWQLDHSKRPDAKSCAEILQRFFKPQPEPELAPIPDDCAGTDADTTAASGFVSFGAFNSSTE